MAIHGEQPINFNPEDFQPPTPETLAEVDAAFAELGDIAEGRRITLLQEGFVSSEGKVAVTCVEGQPMRNGLPVGEVTTTDVTVAVQNLDKVVTHIGHPHLDEDETASRAVIDQQLAAILPALSPDQAARLREWYSVTSLERGDPRKQAVVSEIVTASASPRHMGEIYDLGLVVLPNGVGLSGRWAEGDPKALKSQNVRMRRDLLLSKPDGTAYIYKQPLEGEASLFIYRPSNGYAIDSGHLPASADEEREVMYHVAVQAADAGADRPTESGLAEFVSELRAVISEEKESKIRPSQETQDNFKQITNELDNMSNVRVDHVIRHSYENPKSHLVVEVSGMYSGDERQISLGPMEQDDSIATFHVAVAKSADDIERGKAIVAGNMADPPGEQEIDLLSTEVDELIAALPPAEARWLQESYSIAKSLISPELDESDEAQQAVKASIDRLAAMRPEYLHTFTNLELPEIRFANGSTLWALSLQGDPEATQQVYPKDNLRAIYLRVGDGTHYLYRVLANGKQSLDVEYPRASSLLGEGSPTDTMLKKLTSRYIELENDEANERIVPVNEHTLKKFNAALRQAFRSGFAVDATTADEHQAKAQLREILERGQPYEPR